MLRHFSLLIHDVNMYQNILRSDRKSVMREFPKSGQLRRLDPGRLRSAPALQVDRLRIATRAKRLPISPLPIVSRRPAAALIRDHAPPNQQPDTGPPDRL